LFCALVVDTTANVALVNRPGVIASHDSSSRRTTAEASNALVSLALNVCSSPAFSLSHTSRV
jgi:hypothetical protein